MDYLGDRAREFSENWKTGAGILGEEAGELGDKAGEFASRAGEFAGSDAGKLAAGAVALNALLTALHMPKVSSPINKVANAVDDLPVKPPTPDFDIAPPTDPNKTPMRPPPPALEELQAAAAARNAARPEPMMPRGDDKPTLRAPTPPLDQARGAASANVAQSRLSKMADGAAKEFGRLQAAGQKPNLEQAVKLYANQRGISDPSEIEMLLQETTKRFMR